MIVLTPARYQAAHLVDDRRAMMVDFAMWVAGEIRLDGVSMIDAASMVDEYLKGRHV